MYIHSHQTTPAAGAVGTTTPAGSLYRLPADRKWQVRHSRWYLPAVIGVLTVLLIPGGAFTQTRGAASMSSGSSTSTGAGATLGTSGGAAASSSGVSSPSTLRSPGTTTSGSPAGTPGTDPGASSAQPAAAAPSGTTLRPVGVNVDGSVAGTTGTDPGSQTLGNPLNRNPANRPVVPDAAPPADASNSTTRPTTGAVTSPDSRDTLVAPDPSRDSTTIR